MTCRRFNPLPDVFLRGEEEEVCPLSNDETQEITLARAEARARVRQRRNGSRQLRGTDRQFAEALHREADSLHYKGDYETALVLYHRASSVCPRDSSHGVAARRTAAAINAITNPNKALNGLLSTVRNGAQQSAAVCPESAALRASRILEESSDPVSVVPQIVGYFDARKDFWRKSKTRVIQARRSPASPETRIANMEAALNAGEPVNALRIGGEVLESLSHESAESKAAQRCAATVHRLVALAHVALGRHDRAVASASRMTRAALTVDVTALIIQALVALGKVHLAFGHLGAAARAWEALVPSVYEPIPRAWLFHEIGRCHLENGDHKRALRLAVGCLETAEAADSDKWTFHGRLLLGQALAELGRFAEAASALRGLTALAGDEAGDARTVAYVRDLTERVFRASDGSGGRLEARGAGGSAGKHLPEFSKREGRGEESGSESDEDGEAETTLDGNFNLSEIADEDFRPSDESSLQSFETESPRTILDHEENPGFEMGNAAGEPGDPGVGELSIANAALGGPRASRESVSTGRTYGVSSPLFRSVAKTATTGRRDVSDSDTVSTIFRT